MALFFVKESANIWAGFYTDVISWHVIFQN